MNDGAMAREWARLVYRNEQLRERAERLDRLRRVDYWHGWLWGACAGLLVGLVVALCVSARF